MHTPTIDHRQAGQIERSPPRRSGTGCLLVVLQDQDQVKFLVTW